MSTLQGPGRDRRLGAVAGGLVALTAGLIVGYLNTHTDELLVVLPVLVLLTGTLGALGPTGVWYWVLPGLAVPGSQFVARLLGLHVPYPNEPADIANACVALIPAGIGGVLGWGLRRGLTLPPGPPMRHEHG